MKCLILLRAREVTAKFSQSRLGLCAAVGTISTMSPFFGGGRSGPTPPVCAGPPALVTDVGVNRVGKGNRRGALRQHFHGAARREGVDLFRIEIDLQVR